MQQEASTKLGFGAKKTMSVAQKMYEGIDLGGNMEGLITYMRSDSTRLSDIFVGDAKDFITNTYGKEYVGHVHQKMVRIHKMRTKQFDQQILIVHQNRLRTTLQMINIVCIP